MWHKAQVKLLSVHVSNTLCKGRRHCVSHDAVSHKDSYIHWQTQARGWLTEAFPKLYFGALKFFCLHVGREYQFLFLNTFICQALFSPV